MKEEEWTAGSSCADRLDTILGYTVTLCWDCEAEARGHDEDEDEAEISGRRGVDREGGGRGATSITTSGFIMCSKIDLS